jgi:hypothetical protein
MAPARVRVERGARRQPLVVGVMVDRGTHAGPRVDGRDRAVGTECQPHTGSMHAAERVHRPGAIMPQPTLVQLPGSAPGSIEPRLHARHDAEFGHRGDVIVRRHLDVLQPMTCRDDRAPAERLGRGTQPCRDLADSPITDHVEAGLSARPRAGDDVITNPFAVEVQVACRGGVGVGRGHGSRARADRSVDAEVTGIPDDALRRELVVEELPPVRHDLRQRVLGRDLPDQVEVVERRDVRGVELVQGGDASAGRMLEGEADRMAPVTRAPQAVRDVAGGVVRVALDAPVVGPAVDVCQLGAQSQQGRGDDGGVGVDARDVGGYVTDRVIELGPRRRTTIGPRALVPAVREQHRSTMRRGIGTQSVEGCFTIRCAAQVDRLQGETRRRDMDVCVDEAWCHQAAAELDDLVGIVDLCRCGILIPHPGDEAVDDQHRRRGRHAGRVDAPAAQEHSAVRTGVHGPILPSRARVGTRRATAHRRTCAAGTARSRRDRVHSRFLRAW